MEAWRKPLVSEKTSTRLPARAAGRAHAAFGAATADPAGTTVSRLREEPVEQAATASRAAQAASALADVGRRGVHMDREWLTMDERRGRADAR